MMLNRKRPLRTYERKTAKKPFTNLLPSPIILISKYDSLCDDPFETTFDRIAKGAVVPPIPPDTYQNDSWKGSSSDSDINNSTTNITKAHSHKASDLICDGPDTLNSSCSYISKLTHRSNKLPRKCRGLQRNKSEVVFKKIASKKTITTPKNKIQCRRQRNKRKKTQSKRASRTCNKQTSHENSDTNLEDMKNDTSYNNNNKHLYKRVSKIKNISQTEWNKTNSPIAAFKYASKCQQNIKPCFVELDACTVQKYVVDHGKIMGAKQDTLHDIKCTGTSRAKRDISKEYNDISQPISSEYNNIIERFKHLSIKQCFVALRDIDIVKNRLSRTEKSINDSVDTKNKSNKSHLIPYNSSASFNSAKLVPYNTKRESWEEKLIKDSVVKVEKLKVQEFIKKDSMVFTGRERDIISSTPISKYVKSHACSTSFSPINNTRDTLYPIYKYSNVRKDISDIVLPNRNNSPSLIMPSKCDSDIVDVHEQSTQVLLSSWKMQTRDSLKIGASLSSEENIHTLPTQKYNVKSDVIREAPARSLNISSIADTDPSLFSDYSSKNIECQVQKIHSTNTSTCDKIAHTTDSFVDLGLERKRINTNTEDEIVNNDKSSSFSEDQDVNINNTVFLARLQDSLKITGRRTRYSKWLSNQLSSFKSSIDEAESNSEIFRCEIDEIRDIPSEICNFECSTNAMKKSLDFTQLLDDENKRVEKSVFLKPGKYWARSLSILHRINDGSNLDKLSLGKGKRWRHSVKDILDMQKQGIFQSCLKKDKDDADLSCKELDASDIVLSFDDDKHKTFNSENHARLSKRISVRVVPNNTSTGCKIKDTSFLEAFGIKSEKSSSLELSLHEKSHNNRISKRHSTTAKDLVLQRCLQKSYLSFSHCFPDSYLKYCCKIGEGVYGEVFLYEYLDKKSVLKIIPIEGDKLVNGEPQKKFNEILSEIVIAKELDNLRLNTVYKTSGFVEVRSIKCIIGKYPKRLVELWNIYDDNKTSDNDCPSMFEENQLYIALELGDGGEDMEAFVFQTAEEARALFLQTAFALAIAEKALEFEHRDLHWGNVLISRTKEPYIYYTLNGREIKLPSNGVKVSIIDFTLSRMLYQGCCIYNDLALDPALFTAYGEYQFEIYRLMREKIQNNWNKFEPYTNILWLHYILDKMITAVRYKRKNVKVHKHAIVRLKEFRDIILNYDNAFDFVTDSSVVHL
ncbi:uncharacterized protein LOC105250493 isoform X2 [Camponotus floridanus]|uniref:uncharacterized protein LOC105250493 isoform X2 n=1 Tax=Camponotus floridanus TaxID=104421 RepID=UPI00059D7820|nr:uncharacterized protein LOC105250493 isoform X2 [Camponotus floridanus]